MFQNYYEQLTVPYVTNADCEAITEKGHGCKPKNDKSYT